MGSTSNQNTSPASGQTTFDDLVSPGHVQIGDRKPHSPLLLQRQLQPLRFPPKLIVGLSPPNPHKPPYHLFHQTPIPTLHQERFSTHRCVLFLALILRTPTIVEIPNIRTIEPCFPQALIDLIMHMTRPRRGGRARLGLRWVFRQNLPEVACALATKCPISQTRFP